MYIIKKVLGTLGFVGIFFAPGVAHAGDVIDALNLAPFVPMVLDALMMVATGTYDFFVDDGHGIIQILIWMFLGITIAFTLAKIYIPKSWGTLLGWSGVGEIEGGKLSGVQVVEKVAKPGVRAVIATIALLQIRPVFLTQWLINPFLELGAVYTNTITSTINEVGINVPDIECPPDILEKAWVSPESCKFLVQPVADLSNANNQIVKRGFEFLTTGLRGMITLVPHGGQDFLNLITGILLIITFVGSNLFMALLIIQGIFNFGMQLVLYPFHVLTYVVKSSNKWLDVWPVFGGITKALQQLIVTMIACAFILCINLAVIKALFNWNTSIFVVAAGGSAYSNIPTASANTMGFGEHSMMWISAILTFYLFFKIYDLTQEQLNKYIGGGMDGLYKQVKSDTSTMIGNVKKWGTTIGKAAGWIKK